MAFPPLRGLWFVSPWPNHGKEHKSHADRLRTVSLVFAGTEMEHMPISAPEKMGFQEAIAVRDVGIVPRPRCA